MKKYIYFIPVLILIVIVGYLYKSKSTQIVHPKEGPIIESVYAISTVKSEWNYALRLGVISSVEKYFVKEGDEVKPNQPLLQIENGSIFKSPHKGIVTEKPFGIKETIIPQTPIIKIVDLNNLYIEASIEQVAALKVTKGMKVIISFEDFRNKTFEGTIRSVLPREQEFLIQVTPQNLPKNILPGMSADLSIEVGRKEKAMTVPVSAISNGYILKKIDGKIQKIKVEIGVSDAEQAEITSPALTTADEIVLPSKVKN